MTQVIQIPQLHIPHKFERFTPAGNEPLHQQLEHTFGVQEEWDRRNWLEIERWVVGLDLTGRLGNPLYLESDYGSLEIGALDEVYMRLIAGDDPSTGQSSVYMGSYDTPKFGTEIVSAEGGRTAWIKYAGEASPYRSFYNVHAENGGMADAGYVATATGAENRLSAGSMAYVMHAGGTPSLEFSIGEVDNWAFSVVTTGAGGSLVGTPTFGCFGNTPVGRQGPIPDATDAATTVTQLNALLAALTLYGLLA